MVAAAGATAEQADEVLELAELQGANDECSRSSTRWSPAARRGEEGVARLRQIYSPPSTAAGVPAERLRLDVSIARGLDYYTGTIFETFLDDAARRSAASAPAAATTTWPELYTTQQLPGHRRVAGPRPAAGGDGRAGHAVEECRTPAEVFIAYFDAEPAARLPAAGRRNCAPPGIGVEVYPGAEEARPATQVRRPPRLPRGHHRRRERIRRRRGAGQRSENGRRARPFR